MSIRIGLRARENVVQGDTVSGFGHGRRPTGDSLSIAEVPIYVARRRALLGREIYCGSLGNRFRVAVLVGTAPGTTVGDGAGPALDGEPVRASGRLILGFGGGAKRQQ